MKACEFLLSISIGSHPKREAILKMLVETFEAVSEGDGTSLRALGISNESTRAGFCVAMNDVATILDAGLGRQA